MKPIDQFRLNIKEIYKIYDIYKFNHSQFVGGIDIDGLLRTQIVMVVSALDQYIHQVVVERSLDILSNNKPFPNSFSKLLLSYDTLNSVLKTGNISSSLGFIEQDLRIKLGWKSFQQPDKINEILKCISNSNVWNEVATLMSRSSTDIKNQLSLIVKRRDCIAHEADFDYTNYCQYPISLTVSTTAINFIIEIVFMLDSIIYGYIYSQSLVAREMIK